MSLKSKRQTLHYRQRQILQLILGCAQLTRICVRIWIYGCICNWTRGVAFCLSRFMALLHAGPAVDPILEYTTPRPPPTKKRPRLTAFMSYLAFGKDNNKCPDPPVLVGCTL